MIFIHSTISLSSNMLQMLVNAHLKVVAVTTNGDMTASGVAFNTCPNALLTPWPLLIVCIGCVTNLFAILSIITHASNTLCFTIFNYLNNFKKLNLILEFDLRDDISGPNKATSTLDANDAPTLNISNINILRNNFVDLFISLPCFTSFSVDKASIDAFNTSLAAIVIRLIFLNVGNPVMNLCPFSIF